MALDVLAESSLVVGLLKKEGFESLASELEEHFKAAATGTEFYMSVSFALGQALALNLSDTTRARVVKLKREMDEILEK